MRNPGLTKSVKTLAFAISLALLAVNLFAADAPLSEKVLYIGHRAADFEPFLKEYFAKVDVVSRQDFKSSQAEAYDVVLLDWPQGNYPDKEWLHGAPLGNRQDWHKPTVLLGSAGLNLAVAWKLKGGSGCTCLAPVAYNLRDHEIFKSPIPIDISATTNIPTPNDFAAEIKTPTIPVIPLVDGIQEYHNVINNYARGWSTHYYEFADMPEVEVFCGGINEQTPRSAAFWRQGNLLHFGFEQSPAQLNRIGRAMLVNGIVYISHFTQDRPIDITPSIFGPDKIAISRNRAKRYFSDFPSAVPGVFSTNTLAGFDWHDAAAAKTWFDAMRPWLHPDSNNLLEVDNEAKSLGVPFDAPDFLPKTIAALRDAKTQAVAETLLYRYVFEPPEANADAEVWERWWRENSPYLFYSELGNYRWYIDPLAKQRGIPTKDLRGPARMDVASAR
jgi:hypothetical protein